MVWLLIRSKAEVNTNITCLPVYIVYFMDTNKLNMSFMKSHFSCIAKIKNVCHLEFASLQQKCTFTCTYFSSCYYRKEKVC